MRKKAEGEEAVGIEDEVAYEVVNIAVMSRLGVTRCIERWDRESERLKKNVKLHAEFPYFKAKEVVRMIFGEGGVILEKAKNKSYKRSRVIVEAQDLHSSCSSSRREGGVFNGSVVPSSFVQNASP